MRVNQLRERLKQPGALFGVMADIASPRLVELYGLLGFDWVLIDAEHDGISVETCYAYAMAADAAGIASVVRVPENRPEVILGYADTGVSGIIAPHVRNRADADRLVSAIRFPPHGKRGIAGSSRAANYAATQSPKTYFEAVEHQTVICALMEDGEAYDNAEDIISHPGIEVLCMGMGDLSGSLGFPGERGRPEVIERVNKASELVRRHGKIFNCAAGDAAGLADAAGWGARMVMNSNVALVSGAGRAYLQEARTAFGQ